MPRHARQSLADLVDGSHYDDLEKVIDYVHRQQKKLGQPKSSVEEIERELNDKIMLRGKHGQGDLRQHYFHPIYSNHYHQYQIDLLAQSHVPKETGKKDEENGEGQEDGKDYPNFFFMAINTNTKFAYAFPIEAKDTASIKGAFKSLMAATGGKLRDVVSDEEAAVNSKKIRKWLDKKHIGIHFIPDKNHTALAVIDRLIRTLRDMNTPTRYSKETSTHRKYRDFTENRMENLLEIYNTTKHEGTNMTPTEMAADPEAETKYIIRKLYQIERRRKITDFNLPIGAWVRYIIPRDPMKKARYKVSTERYRVAKKAGNAYEMMAEDGSTLQVARWRLLPVDEANRDKRKKGTTLLKGGKGIVKEIIGVRGGKAHKKEYHVVWEVPEGATPKMTWETPAKLRSEQTDKTKETPAEKKYNDKHTRKGRH
jgi:hypothetical protein